jgi:hypothetical protein
MENQTTITEVVNNNERLTNLQLDLLNKHGLAWRVIEEPLVSKSGLPTSNIGLFRTDNNAHLGTHTTRYNPCQNAELAKMLVYACSPIEDLDLEGSRGGEFFGGKKVFFQIPLPAVTIGKTEVQRFLTALNSFDGSTAVALGTCQTVVVCQNTFWKAYKNAEMSKVGHYSTMKAKLEALTEQIHYTIAKDMEQVETFRKMEQTPIFDTDITALKHKIFSIEDAYNIGTRKQNRMLKFDSDLELEFAEQGRNAWGLFNGVTRYTNHTLKANQSYSDKMSNIICGTGAKVNAIAFDHITKSFSLN